MPATFVPCFRQLKDHRQHAGARDATTGFVGGQSHDAENKMTAAWGGNNQWQYYTYNADGQRTRRKIDNHESWQLYGFDGELLAEYAANAVAASPQTEYGYRNCCPSRMN